MSIVEVKVPELSESVSEASLIEWKRKSVNRLRPMKFLLKLKPIRSFWKFRRRRRSAGKH